MGGVIGVLVALEVSDNLKDNATVKELGKDIGMQAAAMNPSFLDKSDVDEATLAKGEGDPPHPGTRGEQDRC